MTKQEQTPQVITKLYQLTNLFVKKYQPAYYKQFSGDVQDLAAEIFCDFMTAKSRVKGNEKSLLDRYDVSLKPANMSEEVFFCNLVKTSTIRKLIDLSRKDRQKYLSIDKSLEAYGDMMSSLFNMVTFQPDLEQNFDRDFIESCRHRFISLKPSVQSKLQSLYLSVRNKISEEYQSLFDKFIPLDSVPDDDYDIYLEVNINGSISKHFLQQLTSKTACIFIDDNVYDFDRISGFCRKKEKFNWCLPSSTLELLNQVSTFKSRFNRQQTIQNFI